MFLTEVHCALVKSLKCITPSVFRGKTAAILDDDETFLSKMIMVYDSVPNIHLYTFLHPTANKEFFRIAHEVDFVIVGYNLGGTNGANIVKKLLKEGIQCKVLLITDSPEEANQFRSFSYFVHKSHLLEDPRYILKLNGSPIDQAVETTVLLQRELGGSRALVHG